jgi:hypothetical protein
MESEAVMMRFKPVVAVVLVILLTVPGMVEAMPFMEELLDEKELMEVHNVRRDIEILNLLNVLYLSREQIDDLLSIHDRRETVIETLTYRLAQDAPAAGRTFSALRHTLLAGRDPEERLVGEIHHTEQGLMKAVSEAAKEYKYLAEEAESVLNESQKVVVTYYVSCISPPKSEINPVRIGESGNEGPRSHMEKLRSLTGEQYQALKPMVIEKLHGHMENIARTHPQVSLEGAREKIAGYLDRVRAMPEVEFKLNPVNPIKEILGPSPFETGQTGEIRPKVMQFLLNSRTAALLRQFRSRDQ